MLLSNVIGNKKIAFLVNLQEMLYNMHRKGDQRRAELPELVKNQKDSRTFQHGAAVFRVTNI